jgi:hypothetical protein
MDVSIAKWRSQPMVIDGAAKEWSMPLRFYDSETKLFFAFVNDSTYLYLCFQSNDKRNQVKINLAGMKVLINTKGKEKHKASIDFPLTDSKLNFAREELNEEVEPDIPNLKNSFLLQNTNMLTKGFATQNGNFPIHDSTGINAALNWNEKNIMTYEIAIPLKELFGANYSAKDLSKTITLVVQVNAITREDSTIDVSSTAMGSAAGSQANGMTRTMPGATTKEKRPLFDKNKCKQKFVLAKKP